jgi:thiol-disulfide isomerase/thioredoxin
MPFPKAARVKRFAKAVPALLALGLLTGTAAVAAGTELLPIGAAAPPFSVTTASGTFDTAASTRPYLVEFFAVWCPHCQREVPIMDRIAATDASRIDVIAVPASPFGFDQTTLLDSSTLAAFANRFHATYPIGNDPFFGVATAYGAATFPLFYVVDATRHIIAVETGEVPFEKLQSDVDQVRAH